MEFVVTNCCTRFILKEYDLDSLLHRRLGGPENRSGPHGAPPPPTERLKNQNIQYNMWYSLFPLSTFTWKSCLRQQHRLVYVVYYVMITSNIYILTYMQLPFQTSFPLKNFLLISNGFTLLILILLIIIITTTIGVCSRFVLWRNIGRIRPKYRTSWKVQWFYSVSQGKFRECLIKPLSFLPTPLPSLYWLMIWTFNARGQYLIHQRSSYSNRK
jgi:hypothetical protein